MVCNLNGSLVGRVGCQQPTQLFSLPTDHNLQYKQINMAVGKKNYIILRKITNSPYLFSKRTSCLQIIRRRKSVVWHNRVKYNVNLISDNVVIFISWLVSWHGKIQGTASESKARQQTLSHCHDKQQLGISAPHSSSRQPWYQLRGGRRALRPLVQVYKLKLLNCFCESRCCIKIRNQFYVLDIQCGVYNSKKMSQRA